MKVTPRTPSKPKTAHGWAIHGTHGIYIGWWQRRSDAIREHCYAYLGTTDLSEGCTSEAAVWKYRRERGDRCVRVTISISPPQKKKGR